jgi:hypothetical protein
LKFDGVKGDGNDDDFEVVRVLHQHVPPPSYTVLANSLNAPASQIISVAKYECRLRLSWPHAAFCLLAVRDDVQRYSTVPELFPLTFLA